jgi:outer membrane protein OmpA-like peptidoglycan-associated protein
MKKQPVQEEQGEKAPLWIISFADMISLLMAFFVMLLTMAHEKSGIIAYEGEGIFEATIAGFKKSVSGAVTPTIFSADSKKHGSGRDTVSFEAHRTYYPIKGDENADRTINAAEERVRRVFDKIGSHGKTAKSQLNWGQPDFVVTPITFRQGLFELDQPAKDFLTKFVTDLQESGAERVKLYVIGLALQESDAARQWRLSAKRAETTANFIREKMPPDSQWQIYSWGAGAGGDWVVKDSITAGQSPIFIGVVKEDQQ